MNKLVKMLSVHLSVCVSVWIITWMMQTVVKREK